MEVESHEEALVEIMIFCKLRPAALEVLFAGVVVPNLHFVWSSSTRLFTKNRFSQFSPVHELGEIQRQVLNLAALPVGDAKERKNSGGSRRSTRRRSTWTWGSAIHLWFILATRWAARTMLCQSG
jgi:hypothetical protein